MDDQSLKIALWVLGVVWSLIQVLSIALARVLWGQVARNEKEIQELRNEFQGLRVSIVERHPTKTEFQAAVSEITRRMDQGFAEMKQTNAEGHSTLRDSIVSIFNKLEGKVDRHK